MSQSLLEIACLRATAIFDNQAADSGHTPYSAALQAIEECLPTLPDILQFVDELFTAIEDPIEADDNWFEILQKQGVAYIQQYVMKHSIHPELVARSL